MCQIKPRSAEYLTSEIWTHFANDRICIIQPAAVDCGKGHPALQITEVFSFGNQIPTGKAPNCLAFFRNGSLEISKYARKRAKPHIVGYPPDNSIKDECKQDFGAYTLFAKMLSFWLIY